MSLTPAHAAAQEGEHVLAAAGDISPDPFRPDLGGLNDLDTAALVESINPDRVAPLGDNQYEYGRLRAYQHPEGYAGSWGRPAIYDLSCPVAGNHEYLNTPGASGFQTYFALRSPPERLRGPGGPARPRLLRLQPRDLAGVRAQQ